MRIIEQVLLSEGQTGLALDTWMSPWTRVQFEQWALDNGIFDYVKVASFYTAECIGDIRHPAIQVAKDAPESVLSLCLLKWS